MSGKEIVVYGISHHRAPVSVRERLAAEPERVADELRGLLDGDALSEGVLVSTCNRVELIATTADPLRAREHVLSRFNLRTAPERVDDFVYEHRGREAVRHLFRVACGLDSMVLGVPQILGQVKEAFSVASQTGAVGPLLGRCFDRSFGVAKRVRTETEIAAGNVSVSSIACELAGQIFGDLLERKVLLIGAGKMSETAARSLTARGATLTVVNRSLERAQELAKACGGVPKPLEQLATELAAADVVISSTAKQGFIVTYELMLGVVKMRKWRQLFIIDIAVPRDVDPRVESLRNVFLYDMDDLKRVSQANLAARERAAIAAQSIVDEEVVKYDAWLQTLELTPTIVALRERVRETVLREKQKALPKLGALSPPQERALDAMCESIVNQLLHAPLTELKQDGAGEEGGPKLVEAVRRLFRLEVHTPAAAPKPEAGLAPAEAPAAGSRPRNS
jgi:glutamyl-tRNA reductase